MTASPCIEKSLMQVSSVFLFELENALGLQQTADQGCESALYEFALQLR
jgi:hypothetical protein